MVLKSEQFTDSWAALGSALLYVYESAEKNSLDSHEAVIVLVHILKSYVCFP